jgi:RNA polymerase sigma-70 factor (ECF subfamily)
MLLPSEPPCCRYVSESAPGPESALPRLLLEQRDGLFAYVLALVRNWAVAEDLFQEVSLAVLQEAQKGTVVEDFGPWSREIARRRVLNYWKTSSRTRLILSTEALEALDRAFEAHDEEGREREQELLQNLRRCLQKLPGHLREVVDLRYREALPLQEIARRLGRSAGSVQVALSRIRMRLHDCARHVDPGQEGAPA